MGFLSSTLYLLVWCSKGVTEWTFLCLRVYSWGVLQVVLITARSSSTRRTVEEAHGRSFTRCTVPRLNTQREQELWPPRRDGSLFLSSVKSSSSSTVSSRRTAQVLHRAEIWSPFWSGSCLLFCCRPCSPPTVAPLGVSPVVSDQLWLTEREANDRTELCVSVWALGPFCCFILPYFGCFFFSHVFCYS